MMRTVLAPGVGWPHPLVEPEPAVLKRGGRTEKLTREEVQWLRQLRAKGASLYQLQQIFHRGKATLISAHNSRGPYEGY